MKKRIRADLSQAEFETIPITPQSMAIQAAQAQQNAIRQAVQAAIAMFRGIEPVRIEVTFEGVTVSIEISPQALQAKAFLTSRVDTALDLAVNQVKQKAGVKRGPKRNKTPAGNPEWFWSTFKQAVKKARAKLPQKNQRLEIGHVAAEWLGKDGGCSADNVRKLCRKYAFDSDGDHFGKALERIS
jgi:hypothetical protein